MVSRRSDAFLRREIRLEPKSELTVFKMCALVTTELPWRPPVNNWIGNMTHTGVFVLPTLSETEP